MSTIVLAVSDRWIPDARVEAIGDFAQRLGSEILAVHVALGTEGGGADISPGERVLEKVAGLLRTKTQQVQTQLLFSDDLAAALLKTVEERGASLLILGLSSKGMLTRLIEGNVAQELIKSATVPLLLLPPEWAGGI